MNRKIISYGFFMVIILSCLPSYSMDIGSEETREAAANLRNHMTQPREGINDNRRATVNQYLGDNHNYNFGGLSDDTDLTWGQMFRADLKLSFRNLVVQSSMGLALAATINTGKFVGGSIQSGLQQLWYWWFPSKEREEKKQWQKRLTENAIKSEEVAVDERIQNVTVKNIALFETLKPQTEEEKEFQQTAILHQLKKYAGQLGIPLKEVALKKDAPEAVPAAA